MASLALGVAGSFIGSAFGPLGASIGWTIGSALGNALFPEKVEGPRLQDLRLHTSSYGRMNPLLWGTMRVAGNVIWIGNGGQLVEHEETSGGKGGPEVTNYTYSASFAIRLVDVELAGIDRIWANGRLISSEDERGDLPITIYLGTETQLPDPTMEADLGVGNVPAHRGVSYVVFTDLYLTDFGNAIPNLEFECYTAAGDIPIRVSTFAAEVNPGDGTVNGVTFDGTVITVTRYGTDQSYAVRHFLIDGTPTGTDFDGTCAGAGILYGQVTNLDVAVYSIDSETAAFYVHGSVGHTLLGPWPTPTVSIGMYQDGVIYFPTDFSDLGGDAGIVGYPVDAEGNPQAVPIGSIVLPGAAAGDLVIGHADNGMVYAWDAGTGSMYECEADLTEITNTWLAADFPSDGGFYHGGFVRYNNLFAFNYGSAILDRLNLISIAASGSPPALTNYDQPRTGAIPDMPDFEWGGGRMAPLGGGRFLGVDGVVLLKPPKEGVVLSVIVADISERCGLDANEIDVTELTDIVDGFLVDQQSTGRDIIQPTRDVYFYDGVEIDDKVVFVKRKAESLVTIPADDLAAHINGEQAPPIVGLTRAQEVDLPAIVTVNYVNAAADYQAGSQTSQRQVTQSQSAVQLTFPISLSDTKAKSVADTHVLLPWVERNRFTAFVSRAYAKYTPTDVITAAGHKFRVIDATESRQGVIKLDGVAALAPVLIQAGIPVTNQTFTSVPETPAVAPVTLLYLLDLPLVSDSDDENGLYAAMRGTAVPWSGAAVYKSVDGGSTYSSIGSSSTAAVMGTTSDALGNWAGGNMFDESNVVTVVLGSGQTLSSVTEAAVLNGANEAAIGDEVIQFKNAELVDDDTYVLSGLLRGRLGTEWAMGSHATGDRFTLLPVLRVPSDFAELHQSRDYKGVTFGKTIASAASQAFINTGRAWDPYSPVLLGGGTNADGDVELHWTRRTRKGGGAWLSVDVPLSEESEQYAVQIWNSDYSLCARAIFPTSQSTTYTAADQIADFGATQQTVYFTVGQIGFASLGTQARGTAPGAGSTNDDPIAPIAPLE